VLHVLNDRLFAVLDQYLAAHLKLIPREGELVPLIRVVQGEAMEVVKDFKRHKFAGSPETFLSDELGYTKHGCRKSLVKFIDEYYWLTLVDELPIPPRWQPQIEPAQNKSSTV
jgi:hypothetical protein